MPLSRRHLTVLDGVRGLALLQVMFAHFATHAALGQSLRWKLAAAPFGMLPNGVDLFFVLSGFLITGILVDAKGKQNYFRNFFARRFLRIFPLYYGVLAVFFGIVGYSIHVRQLADPQYVRLYHEQGWLWAYLTNFELVFSPHLPVAHHFAFAHFWTLAAEEQFYLLWPLVVYLCTPRALLRVCLAGLAAFATLRIFCIAHHNEDAVFYLVRGDGLLAGAMLACLIRQGWHAKNHCRSARRAFVFLALLTPIFTGAAVVGLLTPQFHRTLQILQALSPMHAVLLFWALMVVCLGGSPKEPIRRLLENRFFTFFGKLSYGLYVYHFLLLNLFDQYILRRFITRVTSSPLTVPLYVAVGSTVCVVLALLSWHLYEKQFLKLKRFVPMGEADRRVTQPPHFPRAPELSFSGG